METSLRQSVIEKVYQHARETKQPVLCIIDDTIASKTRPSSQAVHPMEATSNHMSHLKGRMDYGHQAIGVMLACGELVLNYAILLYGKSQSMPHIRLHDLRHSCATLPFAQGVPMKEIQAWFGHSTIGTTANIYTHLDENSKINSANAIIGILEQKKALRAAKLRVSFSKWCRQRESNPYGFWAEGF